MIDDKKIESAANKHIETEYARYNSGDVEEEMYCNWGTRSLEDVCQMCHKVHDMAYMMNNKN